MNEFITIKEAGKLTGKSEVTIRRLIKRALKSEYAEADQLITQKRTPSGFIYTMDTAFLEHEGLLPAHPTTQEGSQTTHEHKPDTEADQVDEQAQPEKLPESEGEQGDHSPTQGPEQVDSQPLVSALVGTIEVLKNQLSAKDDQIRAFQNAQERHDVLLKNLQDKIYLLEQPEPVESEPEPQEQSEQGTGEQEPVDDAPEQASEPEQDKPAKATSGRRWWSFSKN